MKIKVDISCLHDRGVFALMDIEKDEIIEICPVIVLNSKDIRQINKTLLYDYYFSWLNKNGAIALGFGSLYNHSYEPNAVYSKDFVKRCIRFTALKSIKKGEEITVNYNGDPTSKKKVWFEKQNNCLKIW